MINFPGGFKIYKHVANQCSYNEAIVSGDGDVHDICWDDEWVEDVFACGDSKLSL